MYLPFTSPSFRTTPAADFPNLSDQLNNALVNRFVNQTRLRLVSDPAQADIPHERGVINAYSNRPFSVAGDQTASLNRVQVSVRASYQYADENDSSLVEGL